MGSTDRDFSDIPSDKYTSLFKSSNVTNKPQWRRDQRTVKPLYGVEQDTTVCSLRFDLPNDIGPPVLLYYRLTNFYQNHRRYVKSLNTEQLLGKALDNDTINRSACDPLKLNATSKKPYYPCGLIANSLFNDTINTPTAITAPGRPDGLATYPMTNKGIAWSSDDQLYKKTAYRREHVEPPPNWRNRYPDGYTAENDIPDISQYEELQVWMRTAGLPTFSKLARRNDNLTMQAGTYQIDVYDCRLLRPFFKSCLTTHRFPCRCLWWDEINFALYTYCHGWQEPIPRNRLRGRGWHMCSTGCLVHNCSSHQTEVSEKVPFNPPSVILT